MDHLPEALEEIAGRALKTLRSLTELGGLLSPPVGKSGVNHRMRKLRRRQQLREAKEEQTMTSKGNYHRQGLRAAPGGDAAGQHRQYLSSQIMVIMGNKRVNCKSLMGMISLGVSEGDRVHLSADGPDEGKAVSTMAKMIEDGFPGADSSAARPAMAAPAR